MTKKIYANVDQLPDGIASDIITEGCIVLEGGAFRGLYTRGVLDALMLNDINFQSTVGTSAGALAGLNYVSGNIGRMARFNLTYRHDKRYVGVKPVLSTRNLIDLDFMLKDYNAVEPFNSARFYDPERRYTAVCTNCSNGETLYFEKGKCSNIFDAVKASASMPFVSKMVNVDGTYCLDGGASCKIPYQWAIDQQYSKILVVKTRDNSYRKKTEEREIARKVYRKYPQFAESLDKSNGAYNRQCDEIDKLEKEGRIFVILPSKKVTVSRLEGNVNKLADLYWQGFNDALASLGKLREYLSE